MPLETVFATGAIVGTPEPEVRPWPVGQPTLFYQLDDVAFLPGARVLVTCECSWDGGQTWPWKTEDPFHGGAKGRDGSAPSVTLGPFKEEDDTNPLAGRINNPTHARFSIISTLGLPVVGLKLLV